MGRSFRFLGLAAQLFLAAALAAWPLADAAAQATGSAPAQQQPASNPALAQFREVLERYGTIGEHPRYGEVWLPGAVAQDWMPYPPCYWAYDRRRKAWGYQDPTEWGAIVHHYGRWAHDPHYGWMWIAGSDYGPAQVSWKEEDGQVSWAPLAPEIDNQPVPTAGWRSQDQQSFSAGCPTTPPPPATADAPGPAPAAAPGRPPALAAILGPHCRRFPASPACKDHPAEAGMQKKQPPKALAAGGPSVSPSMQPRTAKPIYGLRPSRAFKPLHVTGGHRLVYRQKPRRNAGHRRK